jgi:Xaa-Pro aminopeptidase
VQPRRHFSGPNTWLDLSATLTELRLLKDSADVTLIRRSVAAAGKGHILGMRAVRPGMREYQLQGVIEFGFRVNGGIGSAYNSIVAGGDNANILHYDTNRDVLKDGDLVLVDAGCEIDCMASDITRTFPVNGTFSPAQAELYDLVLASQLAALEVAKPGGNTEAVHERAVEVLAQGMHDLGIFEESVDTILGEELYRKYYMHRTGHWLGLDVHDVGRYYDGGASKERCSRPFEPGMVFTVEPGLYVAEDATDAPERFRGIGIRIEDDILITDSGHENLSVDCPKTRTEIEAVARDRFDFHFPVVA